MTATFRSYLDALRKSSELIEISTATDARDIAALVPQAEQAILFQKVTGYSIPVASGLLQSRNRLALAMGASYEKIESKLRAAMEHPIAPQRVQRGPVKEVIRTGSDVNLFDLPVPVFSIMDGGPMIIDFQSESRCQ
jgi:2,5-furandicarboxylate decarboxylase 1